MDQTEKFIYAVAVMDTWEQFASKDGDKQTLAKKAYILEKLIPILIPTHSREAVLEILDDIRKTNVLKSVSNVMASKMNQDKMMKELTKSKFNLQDFYKTI